MATRYGPDWDVQVKLLKADHAGSATTVFSPTTPRVPHFQRLVSALDHLPATAPGTQRISNPSPQLLAANQAANIDDLEEELENDVHEDD